MKMRGRGRLCVALTLVIYPLLTTVVALAADKKVSRLQGEYRIYVSGKEIGVEKYLLATSGDSVMSSSILDFRNPDEASQKVSLETKLEMDGKYVPRSYELKSNVNGQKGNIRGSFSPNQAIFEYSGNGASIRNGLLVGDRYTILDTNIFHHFIFLSRLFNYDSGEKTQTFEVLIPQEKDTGTLKIRALAKETIVVQGKKFSVSHLVVDTGAIRIQLWVDGEHVPRKIAVPDKGIEVLHNN